MDVRAMDDHEYDDCGLEIAALFSKDPLKAQAIREAWYDTDDDDQDLIHQFLCENRRTPDALEKAQAFEKLAAKYEVRLRAQQEAKDIAAKAQAAAVKAKDAATPDAPPPVPAPRLTEFKLDPGTIIANKIDPGSFTIRYNTGNAW